MAKIKLTGSGFQMIQEGWHTFKITAVDYKEDFGRMVVEMTTKNGGKHTERFSLLNNKGEINDGAIKAFSYFAKVALNNFDLDEIDEQDIVGCYMKAKVKHVESKTISEKTGLPFVNVNLEEKKPAYSFKDVYEVEVPEDEPEDETIDDLDDLDDLDD